VIDAQGTEYGATYPRRAKGLARKGRARFIEDKTLMLACPPKNYTILEDTMNDNNNSNMEMPVGNGPRTVNRITLEPRKWKVDLSGGKAKAQRIFITDMAGGMTEAICLGNWNWDWMYIQSPQMALKANTDYVFTFWFNGGENDVGDESCQFRIHFNDDDENPMIFRLNRDFIKPAVYNKGWYRFVIPFNTGGSEEGTAIVRFEFNAMRAHCAILPDLPEYADLPDEERPDPRVPQRHNIAHGGEGYPRGKSWSKYVFGEGEASTPKAQTQSRRPSIVKLAEMGVDIEGLLEHMDSEDLKDLLRDGDALEKLAEAGVDIEGLLEHMDSDDIAEFVKEIM
jgi:hypothetical protein